MRVKRDNLNFILIEKEGTLLFKKPKEREGKETEFKKKELRK